MKRVLLICALVAYLSSGLVAEETDSKASPKPADKLVQNPAASVSIEPINVTSPKGFILEDAIPMRLRFNRTSRIYVARRRDCPLSGTSAPSPTV